MRIRKLTISNYKSFSVTDEISFDHGFNVIIGPNNVGKTTLLEALSLSFNNKPHLSLTTSPRKGMPLNPYSKVEIVFTFEPGELEESLITLGRSFTVSFNQAYSPENAESLFRSNLKSSLNFKATYQPNNLTGNILFDTPNFTQSPQKPIYFEVDYATHSLRRFNVVATNSLDGNVADICKTLIYVFKAERLNISKW